MEHDPLCHGVIDLIAYLPKKAALKKVKLWGFQQHQNIECACHPAWFRKECPDAELPIWMFPKIVGYPPKSSILIGVFHDFHHPFWNTTIFGNTHIEKDDDQERKIDSESLSLWCFLYMFWYVRFCYDFASLMFQRIILYNLWKQDNWLMVSTHLKNMRVPQCRCKNIWNHRSCRSHRVFCRDS